MNVSMNDVKNVVTKTVSMAKTAVENFNIDKELTEEMFKASTPMVLGSTAVVTIIGIGICGPVAGIRMGLAFGARMGFEMAGVSVVTGATYGTISKCIESLKEESAEVPDEASSEINQEPVLN